jgi:hypothetical protein
MVRIPLHFTSCEALDDCRRRVCLRIPGVPNGSPSNPIKPSGTKKHSGQHESTDRPPLVSSAVAIGEKRDDYGNRQAVLLRS